MNRFWTGAGILLLIGLAAVFSVNGNSNIMVHDLETECRGDRTTSTNIQLQDDNSFRFEGYFPIEDTASSVNFNYQAGKNIVLNVKSQDEPAADFLWNDCLASGVYDLETRSFEEGRYSVEVKHNGERIEKRIVQIEN